MSSDPYTDAERVREQARTLGFTAVGIARADAATGEAAHLDEWLERGLHAGMHWMARDAGKRGDPRVAVPGARSVVALALNYHTPHHHRNEPGIGKISRYAWGDDYHDVLGGKLRQLWGWMEATFPGVGGRWYVDTGPVMEKVWAQRAGIGWIGKHSNLITQEHGSWVFLGEIITTHELEPDAPASDHCGTCRLCIDACPTAAIVEPYVVDSARCLSYLTIEHRGEVAPELQEHYDGWIYGCDVCQDVCPWNERFAHPTTERRFAPRPGMLDVPLDAWAEMSDEEFRERFRGSPVKRAKAEGFRRNIRIAARSGSG
jgi:epoxyqueuosine reductase